MFTSIPSLPQHGVGKVKKAQIDDCSRRPRRGLDYAGHETLYNPTAVHVSRNGVRAPEKLDKGLLQEEEASLRVQSGRGDLARALHADALPRVLGRVRAVRLHDRVTLE